MQAASTPTLPLILVGGRPSSLDSLTEAQLSNFLRYLWELLKTPASTRILPKHQNPLERLKVLREIVTNIYKKRNSCGLIHASEVLARSNPDCLKYYADHTDGHVYIFNEVTKRSLFKIPYSNLLYDSELLGKSYQETDTTPNAINSTDSLKKTSAPNQDRALQNVTINGKQSQTGNNYTIFKRLNSEVEIFSVRNELNERLNPIEETPCNMATSRKRKSMASPISINSKVVKHTDPEIIVIHGDSDVEEDMDSRSDVEIIEQDSDCEFVCEQPTNNKCMGVGVISQVWSGFKDGFEEFSDNNSVCSIDEGSNKSIMIPGRHRKGMPLTLPRGNRTLLGNRTPVKNIWSARDSFIKVYPESKERAIIEKEPVYICIDLVDGPTDERHNEETRNSILSPSKRNHKTFLSPHHVKTRSKDCLSNEKRIDLIPEEIIILDDDIAEEEEEDVLQYLGLRGPRPQNVVSRVPLPNQPIRKKDCCKFSINMIPFLVQRNLLNSTCMSPGPPGQNSMYVTSNKIENRLVCDKKVLRPKYSKKCRIKEWIHARNYTFPTKTYRTVKPVELPPKKTKSTPVPTATSKTKKPENPLFAKWKLKECSVVIKRLNLSKSLS